MFKLTSGAMRRCVLAVLAIALWVTVPAGYSQSLDLGHQVLRERGLQVMALVYSWTGQYPFDPDRWAESNFTTIDCGQGRIAILIAENYGIDWKLQGNYVEELTPDPNIPPGTDGPYNHRVCYEISHEPDIDDPNVVLDMAARIAAVRQAYPNVPVYCRLKAGPGSMQPYLDSDIQNYVTTAQPDFLVYGDYLFFDGNPPEPHHPNHFPRLEQFRQIALDANIPYGTGLQTWYGNDNLTALTYGYKFLNSFVYDGWDSPWLIPVLFSDSRGTANPTPLFYQLAASNAEVRYLGRALVYLLSTDVRYITGTPGGTLPERTARWQAGASDSYITSIQVINDPSPDDLVVGYFKPMLEQDDGPALSNQIYFMITNCRHGYDLSAAGAAQTVQVNFDFASAPAVDGTAITSLQRLNRQTGLVELISDGGTYDGLTYSKTGPTTYSMTVTLPGGTGDLFKFYTGAFFVNGATCADIADAGGTLAADLNKDCYVNLLDFAVFAESWLLCNDPNDPQCTVDCSDPAYADICK